MRGPGGGGGSSSESGENNKGHSGDNTEVEEEIVRYIVIRYWEGVERSKYFIET